MFKSLNKLLVIIDKNNLAKFYFLLIIILTLSILEIVSIGLVLPVVTFLVNENSIILFKDFVNIKTITDASNEDVISYSVLILLLVFFIKFVFQVVFYKKQNEIVFDIMYVLSKKLFDNYLNKPFNFFLNKNS